MAGLENLPEDVKHLICAEVAAAEGQSLRQLWQVSRTWRAVAESFVYRGLEWGVILAEGDSSAKDDARRLVEDDVGKKYLEHARTIYIYSTTRSRSRSADNSDSENDSTDDSTETTPWSGLSPIRPSFSLSEPISPRFDSVFSSDGKFDRSVAEQRWEPVTHTLSKFKHLTDIVIQTQTRIPPGLMVAIENYHPTCRLHLRNFRFKSLHEEVTDPDERALATSGNLHSLSIRYLYRDSRGVDDHNGAAALRTVALAKNLKHVRMLGCRPASSPALYRSRGRPIEPWKGFIPAINEDDQGDRTVQRKTKLESLTFSGYSNDFNTEKLARWEESADLSHLKVLSCSTSKEAFLRLVATQYTFPSLENLSLTLSPSKRDNLDGWQPAVEQFFASLAPLISLRLSGSLHGPLIDAIVETHGATLQELSLKPYTDGYDMPAQPLRITAPVMELLAAKAPKLTSLNLTLRRSMGDRTETRCYEALGTLQNLKHVKLGLDCSNASTMNLAPEDHWDDFDKATQTRAGSFPKHYNGHLKIAMVNSALDEILVRQIWGVINEKRTKDTVQSLDITTYGGSSFANTHPGDLSTIVQHVSRHYKVTADPAFDGGIEIVELSKKAREDRDALQRKHEQTMLEKWGHKGSNGDSWAVFKHIWPYGEDEDWRTAWKSWPLQRSDEPTED